MSKYSYKNDEMAKAKATAKELMAPMPNFVQEYVIAMAMSTAASSLLAYVYDIVAFIRWWHDYVPDNASKGLNELTLEDLGNVTARDINEYFYNNATQNSQTIARKCSSLNSFYEYLVRMCDLPQNPMDKVLRPSVKKDKRIVRLERNEVAELLSAIENGCPGMSEHQIRYLSNTRVRDMAIVSLLLGTGIRVSELVGLDIDDVSFSAHEIQVIRKGNKKQTLAVGDEALEALSAYMTERVCIEPETPEDRNALFLSLKKTRLKPQAIQNMISNYTTALGFGKRITPHKLRKTYGTELYNETRDIYLVANALGHERVDTTTQYYVDNNLKDLQAVRNIVSFKDKKD